jgi:hypothetical protein
VSEQAKKTKNKIYSDEELMDYYQKEFDKTSESKSAIAELNTYYKKYVDPDGEITDPAQYGAAKMAKLQEGHEIKTGIVSKRDLDKAFQQSLIKISLIQNKGEIIPPPKAPDGENYDLTERLQGIKVTGIATGKTYGFLPDTKVLYNPNTKLVTYTDVNGVVHSSPFPEFKKNISTVNTAQDLKIVDEVMNSIGTPKSKGINKPPKGELD